MPKVETLYVTYQDVIDEFGRDRVQNRFQDLLLEYQQFIQSNSLSSDEVIINSYCLMHAILDYFTDISRLKKFHQINRVNTFKVIAYQINWLLRRKPIQIVKDEDEKLVYINEKFALSYIMSRFTSIVGEDFYGKLNDDNRAVIDGYSHSLYYYLKYRNCSAQVLELAMLSIGAGIAACNRELSDDLKDAFLSLKSE